MIRNRIGLAPCPALANVFSRGESVEILEKKKSPTGRLRGRCKTPRRDPEFVAGPKTQNRLKNRFILRPSQTVRFRNCLILMARPKRFELLTPKF